MMPKAADVPTATKMLSLILALPLDARMDTVALVVRAFCDSHKRPTPTKGTPTETRDTTTQHGRTGN